MKTRTILLGSASFFAAVIVIVLFVRIGETNNALAELAQQQKAQLSGLQDSVTALRKDIAALRALAPGLGEYMTAIQLHMGKLWFAARAANWGLATYELSELIEAVDGAESLHEVKNSVDVASVLAAVENTQVPLLDRAIGEKNPSRFTIAYTQTLEACNGCHRAAGNGFIHITLPAGPPVTNQRWAPSAD